PLHRDGITTASRHLRQEAAPRPGRFLGKVQLMTMQRPETGRMIPGMEENPRDEALRAQQPPAHPGGYGRDFAPPVSRTARGRWGTGAVAAAMLAAGLVGGAAGLGGSSLLDHQTQATGAGQHAPVVVNKVGALSVTAAAAKASPSVVTISVTAGSSAGTGSGIVLDSSGHILTNTHVVTLDGTAAHPAIQVRAANGTVYPASVVGTDPLSDLAVVQAQGASLPPISFGNPGSINVGDPVVAIGAPLGLPGTVTSGIVSTLDRTISVASSAPPQGGDQQPGGGQGFQFAPPGTGPSPQARSTVSLDVIQTDAPINPGNSGGALVDADGNLVGVNVAIASTGPGAGATAQSGSIGVGFSIPADYARRIGGELIANGSAAHALLGVSVRPAAPAGDPRSPFSVGALVAQVTAGSPADRAGIRAGDVITRFGAHAIDDASSLTAAVHEQAPGTTVKVTLARSGHSTSTDVTLATAP
ncbi:S1C family serine protease, partial [Sinomonas sp.]|uniref:S1C family serine protease n=1 Tax=Sinomonas sp. TaxID=1914986 RepID=UPI002FE16A5D